mgnify:FL=1
MSHWYFASVLSAIFFSASALALTPNEIASIKPGTQLELPVVDTDTPALETIDIHTVATITYPDGTLWYRFNGKRRDQSAAAIIAHIENGQVEVVSSIRLLKLRDIGANPKQVWRMDKLAQGELNFENQPYKFNADESDDAKYVDTSGTQTSISYYKFENATDDDLSLMVFEWAEDNFEVLALEWVDSEKARIK